MEPRLDLLPWWLPVLCAALCTAFATVLSPNRWPVFLFASGLGAMGGLCLGAVIWFPSDGIAASYLPIVIAILTVVAILASSVAALVARNVVISPGTNHTALWVALLTAVAFGPVALALTPPLVARRITRNDRLATERFASLKNAVERTAAEAGGRSGICDGSALREHYVGPSFSDEDCRRITDNYVKQDGYIFMVYCHESHGYTIDVRPDRQRGDGTLQLCTDESRKAGCRVEWNRSRNARLPCVK